VNESKAAKRALLLVVVLVLAGACATAHGRFDRAIENLAEELGTSYVIPSRGARYAAMLRDNLARGGYAGVEDRGAIAERLTADLLAVAPDGHLRVEPVPRDGEPTRAGAKGPAGARGPRLRRRPPPIPEARWIADGVGYIRFNEFPGHPETVAAVDRFMKEHAAARAIIIDARTHRGGAIEEMNVLLSFLFASETTLVFMDLSESEVTKRGPPPDEGPTLRRIAAPPGILRREHVAIPNPVEHDLFDAAVFYLVSNRTASAAEHLALAFKRTGRAVLVGEQTAGGNHFGGYQPLGDGLAVFLPVGRTLDPDTGKDWESVGIQPDVAVPADRALDEALRLANRAE
jgi:hypothetical protein